MTKRSRDSVITTACTPQFKQQTRCPSKRPRTELFLQEVGRHLDTMHSCSYFHAALHNMTSSESDSEFIVRNERVKDIESSKRSVMNHMSEYQSSFISHSQELKREANDAIQLSEVFDCFEKSIWKQDSKTEATKCKLSMLNQGPDTTAAILTVVSEFAGRPSTIETNDMKQLLPLVSKFCTP